MILPSWDDLLSKFSEFQKESDNILHDKIDTFRDNNPLLDKSIRTAIQLLPSPFNTLIENFYTTSENSDQLQRIQEIKDLLEKIETNEEKNKNAISAGRDAIGVNVDGSGNIIAKNITLVTNEVKEYFGLDLISKGYFRGINTQPDFENWIAGFPFSLPSIYQGKEFRRETLLQGIKKKLQDNRKLLLLGESGSSKSTILMEILCDYYKDDYIVLYNEGITEPREPNKIIESIRELLNTDTKILVVVDNVHEKKMASIFYVITTLELYYSPSTNSKSDIRFILAARQPEYKHLITNEQFGINSQYMDALGKLNNNRNFSMDIPLFTKEEVKEFIAKYHDYLPDSRKNKSIEKNAEEIYQDTKGNPILVRFLVTGEGLLNDVKSRYKNYLSFDKNGRRLPDYNRIITSFVCSLYHITTLHLDDDLLEKMKIQTSEDGVLVEKNLYQFANDLDGGVLHRSSDKQWKTLHVRWAQELFKFIFDHFKNDRNLFDKFKENLQKSINFIVQNESEYNLLYVFNSVYNSLAKNKYIDLDIVQEVAGVPDHFKKETKSQLYSIVICPCIGVIKGHDQAIKCYDEAIRIDPNYADAYYNKGVALGNLEKYDEEIKCYDEAIRIDPNYAGAYYNKGVALDYLDKYDEEIKCYDEAIRIDPNIAVAYNNKGLALDYLEKYYDAIKCYDEAIRIDPNHANAYYNRACTKCKTNKIKNSLTDLKTAIKLDKIYIDLAREDSDSDFKSIKDNKEFRLLVNEKI